LTASSEPSIDTDDEQLMLDYASGNSQAFSHLYARHEQSIYRYAYNGCNTEAQAHELFQEIWLRVIKSRSSFQPLQPFKPWLYRIARNLLIDTYRRQSKSALDNSVDDGGNPETWANTPLTPEQIASAAQQNSTLRDALQRLPEAQREAVILKHIAGFEISEIADMQGQGVQAVKSRLRYAMVKLRQNLKELS